MVEAFTAHFTCRAARRVLLSNRQDIIPPDLCQTLLERPLNLSKTLPVPL